MKHKFRIEEHTIEHLVIGSGAAGYQAALRLHEGGETDLAIVTEHETAGTSRNTGSDKQTYYKLSLAGDDADSVRAMAEDLFAGHCVDGDQALCEAALSVRCFYRLAEAGVPFPCTEYGEYMGYKTDHDRGRRATSAGPYTSRMMTECLERQAKAEGIPVLDGLQAIKLLVRDGRIYGVLCLDRRKRGAVSGAHASYVLIWCSDVILACGGPAGMYHDSVYPASQTGASGMAFEAGAGGKNLTEWQYGMASLRPRWNVSGTYMQVMPAFISTDQNGNDAREFLQVFYKNREELLYAVFLKGYQWPFDTDKIFGGSSVIDLLVYQETVLKGRRVWLDFRVNPDGEDIAFDRLSDEARAYLSQAGAAFGTPIERLRVMNSPAIAFYKEHGVDLETERLEIAVCAQHNNGGLAADSHWQTNIKGLYAAGEMCGTHGVHRPGGTALNAGQVGALRAAEDICMRKRMERNESGVAREKNNLKYANERIKETLRKEAEAFCSMADKAHGICSPAMLWQRAAKRMSACGAMIRSESGLKDALEQTQEELRSYLNLVKLTDTSQLSMFYKLRDMLVSQRVYLAAMLDYCRHGGGSRGSALYTDKHGQKPDERLPELFRCRADGGAHDELVQEIMAEADLAANLDNAADAALRISWRPVRPIPETDYFFETQWKAYRERMGIC